MLLLDAEAVSSVSCRVGGPNASMKSSQIATSLDSGAKLNLVSWSEDGWKPDWDWTQPLRAAEESLKSGGTVQRCTSVTAQKQPSAVLWFCCVLISEGVSGLGASRPLVLYVRLLSHPLTPSVSLPCRILRSFEGVGPPSSTCLFPHLQWAFWPETTKPPPRTPHLAALCHRPLHHHHCWLH